MLTAVHGTIEKPTAAVAFSTFETLDAVPAQLFLVIAGIVITRAAGTTTVVLAVSRVDLFKIFLCGCTLLTGCIAWLSRFVVQAPQK